jgi:hypothetical protein
VSEDGADDENGLLDDPERFEHSLGPDVPEVDVPTVSIPGEDDDTDGDGVDDGAVDDADAFDTDVDPEVSRTFWRLVVVFDVAFLALALGPMFIYFEGDWNVGGPLVALGAISFLYGVREYRAFRRSRASESPDSSEPAPDDGIEPDESRESGAVDADTGTDERRVADGAGTDDDRNR